jgi:hypothetical protein
MGLELVQRYLRLLGVARRFRPDVLVATDAGVTIGPVGMTLGIPRVVFDQTDRAVIQGVVGLPFASVICTGEGYLKDYGARHIRFRGFLAQAYLDPRRFTPDSVPLRRAGVNPDEPYAVLRLVRWAAAHDIRRRGLDVPSLEKVIARLLHYGRVWISSEDPLPSALAAYRNPVPPQHMHDLLAFAGVCLAEGGMVAMEAGLLGTPAVFFNTYDFGYLRVLEQKYQLIRRAGSLDEALETVEALFQDLDQRRQWRLRSQRLFAETDDVAAVMYRVVEQAAGLSAARPAPGQCAP